MTVNRCMLSAHQSSGQNDAQLSATTHACRSLTEELAHALVLERAARRVKEAYNQVVEPLCDSTIEELDNQIGSSLYAAWQRCVLRVVFVASRLRLAMTKDGLAREKSVLHSKVIQAIGAAQSYSHKTETASCCALAKAFDSLSEQFL